MNLSPREKQFKLSQQTRLERELDEEEQLKIHFNVNTRANVVNDLGKHAAAVARRKKAKAQSEDGLDTRP